jgi:hypothetical protein
MTKALRTGMMDAVMAVTMLRRLSRRPKRRRTRKARSTWSPGKEARGRSELVTRLTDSDLR